MAVGHVLDVIKPNGLKKLLEQDLKQSKVEARKNFTKFPAHALKLSDVSAIVDTGPPGGSFRPDKIIFTLPNGRNRTPKKGKDPELDTDTGNGKGNHPSKPKPLLPFCFFSACASNSERHYI